MANGIPDDVTFTPPAHDMSDVTFTPPSQAQSTSAPAAEPPPQRGVMENVLGGVTEGAAKFVTGAGNMLATGAEKLTGSPAGSLHATFQDNKEAPSVARDAGEGVENIGEFSMGMEGLEGLAKAAKITEMAGKYPLIARTLAMAKEHPVIAKILGETAKGATVGGAQGAVKGEAEGKAKEGAEGGALGGGFGAGFGATLAEAASPIAEGLAKKFGVGTSAVEDAKMGARPGKRNYRFADDFLRAAPHMDDVNALQPAKSVEDWADNAAMARESLYKQKIEPIVAKHATEPLGGLNIANGIRKEIPDAMKTFKPEEAAKMEQIANQFMPGQVFQLQVADAEQALQHYNAELAATGFWSRMPAEREALLKTDGHIAGLKAAGDAIRDEFYGKLNQLEPGSNVAELKKDYGALRNVEDEIRGRVNVNDRQAPMSLKETIGLITGLGTGGPGGAAIAAIPALDRVVNSPENLIGRAVQKAARPGEEGLGGKVAKKAGKVAKEYGPTAVAGGGAELGRIVFTASDGSTHSIPNNPNALAHAKSIDPGLKIVQ
jgi:hypothetical protein